MKRIPKSNRRAGFSLMEIIVAVSILSILAASLAMRAGGMLDKGKVTKIVNLTDSLKTAAAAYHMDVGSLPREFSGHAANNRMLSGTQTTVGWAGPYIESPLTHKQNPFNGSMHLYRNPAANGWIPGFDVDGDGTVEVTAQANMLWLSNVPEASAKSINDAIDRGIPGAWGDTGRVRYKAGSKHVYILVYY